MLLPGIEEIGSKKIQRAASIEVGIINPKLAAILIADNGCVALDMNVCKPEVLRALADLLDGKKPAKKNEAGSVIKPKAKVSKKVK